MRSVNTSDARSDCIRRVVAAHLREARVLEAEFIDELTPWIPPSTAYRILHTDQRLTLDQSEVIVHVAAAITGFDAGAACRALDLPCGDEVIPADEPIAALSDSLAADGEGVDAITAAVEAAAANSQRMLTCRRILPPFLLDEDVVGPVADELCRTATSGCAAVGDGIRQYAEAQREAFMTFGGFGTVQQLSVILLLSDLLRMALRLPPFSEVPIDAVWATIASLVDDGVLVSDRALHLVVVNDVVPGPARRWAWSRLQWASETVFDCGLSVCRRRHTLNCRFLRATRSSFARQTVDRQACELARGFGYACHAPSPQGAADLLSALLKAMECPKRLRRFPFEWETRAN